MSTSHIISLLIEERDRLNLAIEALGGEETNVPDWVTKTFRASPILAPVPAPKKKRKVSASARKRMAEGQRKRWAAINAAKGEAVAPKLSKGEQVMKALDGHLKKAFPKKKSAKAAIAEAVAPTPADTEFKNAMSAAMKLSWAKRKAAAKKKGKTK